MVMRERMQSKRWPGRGLGLSEATARGRGRGEGLGGPGRGLTSPSADRVKWCMGGCFSRTLTEVSGRGAGQTASVVGQQPRPRTSAPAGGSLLLGGKRSPSVSSRCTNQYSVMTGLESGPSPRGRCRGSEVPLAPCAAKGRMKRLRALELARPAPLGATLPIGEASGSPFPATTWLSRIRV